MLERADHSRRLWVEFEISRADPVANHAKLATSHLFSPRPASDTFVAMISSHVDRGRRNLAANMVSLMRLIGINAFQTSLFPKIPPDEIKSMNHLDPSTLAKMRIPVEPEIQRAYSVSQPVTSVVGLPIHFAGDLMEVMLNLRQWNHGLSTPDSAKPWRRRTVTYFVYDPRSGAFAPSKYCAYVPVHPVRSGGCQLDSVAVRPLMTVRLYTSIEPADPIFDGARAREHLTHNLGMIEQTPQQQPRIAVAFEEWLHHHTVNIAVHPVGPVFLLPPSWFR